MSALPFLLPLLGGLTLGLGALWLLYSLGRIAGISGIAWGALAGPDRDWRWLFLAGLLGGGAVTHWLFKMPLPAESTASLGLLISSGLLVGFGTRFGGGCTSGHGVCSATRSGWWRMKAWSAIFAGMLFGLGLTLSGMSDPLKVLGFLDVSGDWIPDLALVMGGALIVSLATTPWVLKHRAPRFASQFHVPTIRTIDQRLAIGAMLFGIGWGLSGYCPGPAIVSLLYGYESTMIFCLAMAAGMLLEAALRRSKVA